MWRGLPLTAEDDWTTPLSGDTITSGAIPPGSTPSGLVTTGTNPLIPITLAGLLLAAGVLIVSRRRWGRGSLAHHDM